MKHTQPLAPGITATRWLSRVSIVAGCAFAGLVLYAILAGESPSERREREAATPKPIAAPVDALQALGDEHHLGANWRCREPIERMATYGYRWTDDALEMKLPAFQWADKTAGILRYHGDRIMYQGEEGGWHRFMVWCDYDTRARAPVGVGATLLRS